ncbi:MAG: YciI family protein [Corynebacterium sp.]|uniref:YciI family protein n=1 Tax=Corynebacterium sp. TaxID=1720 RepID=UPI0026DF118E|nr:YciI family protein [Corynebacterium sp.]MDO5669533.1 YciI family protein [Corynebacterium sp.]
MNYFTVQYRYPDGDETITRVRPEHREWLKTLLDAGQLVASGPHTDGSGGALIIVRLPEGSTVTDAEALMDADPFIREKALQGREIRPWNAVLNVFTPGR